jgi:hypothetical protein
MLEGDAAEADVDLSDIDIEAELAKLIEAGCLAADGDDDVMQHGDGVMPAAASDEVSGVHT